MKILVPLVLFLLFPLQLIFSGNLGAAVLPVSLNYDRGLVSLEGKTSVVSILKILADKAEIEIYIAEKFRDYSNELAFARRPLGEVLEKLLKGYNYAVIYSENSINPREVYSYTELDSFYPVDQAGSDTRYTSQKTVKSRSPAVQDDEDSGAIKNKNKRNLKKDRFSQTLEADAGGNAGLLNPAGVNTKVRTVSGNKTKSGRSFIQNSVADTTINSGQGGTDLETDSMETSYSTNATMQDSDQTYYQTSQSDVGMESTFQQITVLEYQIEQLEEDISSGRADEFFEYWSSKKDPKYVYNHREDLAGKQKKLEQLRGY